MLLQKFTVRRNIKLLLMNERAGVTFGKASKTNAVKAASPYILYAAAFCLIPSASALPTASIADASELPVICQSKYQQCDTSCYKINATFFP